MEAGAELSQRNSSNHRAIEAVLGAMDPSGRRNAENKLRSLVKKFRARPAVVVQVTTTTKKRKNNIITIL